MARSSVARTSSGSGATRDDRVKLQAAVCVAMRIASAAALTRPDRTSLAGLCPTARSEVEVRDIARNPPRTRNGPLKKGPNTTAFRAPPTERDRSWLLTPPRFRLRERSAGDRVLATTAPR